MRKDERFLVALEGGIPDRVPITELGMDPWVYFQLRLRLDHYPSWYRKWVLGLYKEGVRAAGEIIGAFPKGKKSWKRRIFLMDLLAGFFLSPPTSYDVIRKVMVEYIKVHRRFDLDAAIVGTYPSGIVVGYERRGEKNLMVGENAVLYDVDEYGNIREVDVRYGFERMIEHHREIYRDGNIDSRVETVGELLRKCDDMLIIPGIVGIFETWHEIWGISKMADFFKQVNMEFRKGGGIYRELLEEKVSFISRLLKGYSEVGVKCVMIYEDCAMDHGPMVRAELYDSYFAPLIRKICDSAHRYGIKVILHTDGRLKGGSDDPWRFADSLIRNTGIDGLHGLQHGVNDPAEIKERYGKDVCLVGGIGCVDVLQNSHPSEVESKVRKVLEILMRDGGYIACSDNGWHYGVNVENIRRYVKAVRKYGRYD